MSAPEDGAPRLEVGPVPTIWSVQPMATTDGHNHVMLQVQTKQGVSFFFFDADGARDLANGLTKAAGTISSGLTIATAMPPAPPEPNGHGGTRSPYRPEH